MKKAHHDNFAPEPPPPPAPDFQGSGDSVSDDGKRSTRRRRRGAALLLSLLVWATLTIVVAQMDVTSMLALEQSYQEAYRTQCHRALDSVPGIASRMLSETGVDLQFDSLQDHWSLPKVFVFRFGEEEEDVLKLTVTIRDVAGKYDLKGLLDESPERSEASGIEFIGFASSLGLDSLAAEEIVTSIRNEAIIRRAEDEAVMDEFAVDGRTAQQPLPLWLDDFLNLPGISPETRQAFQLAFVEREDPASGETVRVRLADQLTSWRQGGPNVNTAELEVLEHSASFLRSRAEEIVRQRAEEPFRNLSQIQAVASAEEAEEQASPLETADATVMSNRFEVSAMAEYRDYVSRLRMIVERDAQGSITILWRRSEL